MELKIVIYFFCLLFLQQLSAQENLKPLSHCLNNCINCKNDQLSECSGEQHVECVKGYRGVSCNVEENYGNQLVLFNSFDLDKSKLLYQGWKNESISQCKYHNSRNKQIKINTLGIYRQFDFNQVSIQVKPWFQTFIIHFNLIRDPWTPYTDLLRVACYDEQQNQINQYFIEFHQRDFINPQINKLSCDSRPFLVEKYQFQGIFQNQKKMTIKFQGMMFSQANWALSNVKITLGCSKFISYDGISCQMCQKGYYQVRNKYNTLDRCVICPIYCVQCHHRNGCNKCLEGFNIINGQCSNKNTKLSYHVPGNSLTCGQNIIYLSERSGLGQNIEIPIQSSPKHDKIRLHFHFFYVISAEIQNGLVSVFINQKEEIIINGSQLYQQRYPNSKCEGFGLNQHYSVKKISSNYLNHTEDINHIVIEGKNIQKFGLEKFFIEFQKLEKIPKQSQQRLREQNNQHNISKKEPKIAQEDKNQEYKPRNLSQQSELNQSSTNSQANSSGKEPLPDNKQIKQQKQLQRQEKPFQSIKNISQQKTQNILNKTDQKEAIQTFNSTKLLNQSHIEIKKLSNMQDSLQKIIKAKQKIVLGLKYSQQLIITISYPVQIQLFPIIVGHFSKKNKTLVPIVTKSAKKYQQLTFNLKQSFLDEIITLQMSEQNPIKAHKRLLQQNNQIGKINVYRFDYFTPQEKDQFVIFCHVFQYIAWVAIISVIILSFLGSSVLVQQFVLLLQIIFLHIYLFSQYLPLNFRIAISGLRRMENLNYFSQAIANQIQNFILDNVIQYSPDINFSRAVYPCVIINLAYFISFLLLKFIRKLIQPRLFEKNIQSIDITKKIKLFLIRIAERTMNFWYQVWQYQYITFIWAACLQMHNLFYPQGSNRSEISNLIFCFICIVLGLFLPIATYIYLNRRYASQGYFDYCYLLPNGSLPSKQHRIELMLKNFRFIVITVSIAFIGIYPLVAVIILSVINLLSILYTNFSRVQINILVQKLNVTEYLLLMFLQATILLAYGTSVSLEKDIYVVIGYILIGISLFLIFLALVRVLYYTYQKFTNPKVRNKIFDFKNPEGTGQIF